MENGESRNHGGQFAVPENVEECVGYINQTLQSVGLPAAVELTDGGKVSAHSTALNIYCANTWHAAGYSRFPQFDRR